MSDVPASENQNRIPHGHTANRKVAVVQCEGFRCLAYRDPEAQVWRDVETGAELPSVQSVVFEFAV